MIGGPSFHTKESRRMGLSCRSHSIESSHLLELRSARSHPRGKNESSASRYPLPVPETSFLIAHRSV